MAPAVLVAGMREKNVAVCLCASCLCLLCCALGVRLLFGCLPSTSPLSLSLLLLPYRAKIFHILKEFDMPGKQVKNWDKYHALRRKGYSKESAARITNAQKKKKRKKKAR